MHNFPTATRRSALARTSLLLGVLLSPLAQADAIRLDSGVLIDTATHTAYITDPSGYLQAIALDNGAVRWVAGERGLPLDLTQGQLVALGTVQQFGLGMLLLLDPSTGAISDRVAFDLPEWVSAEIVAKPSRRFSMDSSLTADGMRLFWQYYTKPLRGALLSEGEGTGREPEPADHRQMEGALDLHLDGSQGAYTLTVRDAQVRPPQRVPNLSAEQRLPGLDGRQFRAANDTHVLLSSTLEHERYGVIHQWELHDRAGARRIGSLQSHYALAPFMVLDDVLIYRAQPLILEHASGDIEENGTQLRAYDLKRGAELWRVDVMDLEYRGPMPP